LEERVHHERLAAPHPAPDVHAARGLPARAERRHQAVDLPGPVLAIVLELLEEPLQLPQDLQLLAVGLEIVALAEVPVPLERPRILAGVDLLDLRLNLEGFSGPHGSGKALDSHG